MSRYALVGVALALFAVRGLAAGSSALVGIWEPMRRLPDAGWLTLTFAPGGQYESHYTAEDGSGFSTKGSWSVSLLGRTLTIDESDEVLGRRVTTFMWEVQGGKTLRLVPLTKKDYGHESYAELQDFTNVPVEKRTAWFTKTADLVK
jgi:hypothetical protein